MASPGLKCTFIGFTFLSKLLMVFWVCTYFQKNILRISKILALIGPAYSFLIENNSFKKCNAIDLVFFILKRDSSSVIHESFTIFFECPGDLKSVGATQPDLT